MPVSSMKLELLPEHREKPKEEILALIETEIDIFSQFMAGLQDSRASGPLTPMERILIKTYLVHKFRERI